MLKILPPKNENFQIKILIFFLISAQNIDGRYSRVPTIYFLSRNKKKNIVYPYEPQFYYKKVGFKGSTLYRHVFMMQVFVGRFV